MHYEQMINSIQFKTQSMIDELRKELIALGASTGPHPDSREGDIMARIEHLSHVIDDANRADALREALRDGNIVAAHALANRMVTAGGDQEASDLFEYTMRRARRVDEWLGQVLDDERVSTTARALAMVLARNVIEPLTYWDSWRQYSGAPFNRDHLEADHEDGALTVYATRGELGRMINASASTVTNATRELQAMHYIDYTPADNSVVPHSRYALTVKG